MAFWAWLRQRGTWLKGKRTYILAFVVLAVVGTAVFRGDLTPDVASGILLAALAGFAVTFRAAIADHQAEMMEALQDIAAAGVAVRAHDKAAEAALAQTVVAQIKKDIATGANN